VTDEIDIAALAVPPARRPPDPPKRPRVRKPLAEAHRRASIANVRRGAAVASANRGVTMWHHFAIALDDGEWRTTREVWKRMPPIAIRKLASIAGLMVRCGLLERMPTGAPERTSTVNEASGETLWWIPARWLYRLTEKGRAYAREGRLRKLLE
jgi:hypothetical protein